MNEELTKLMILLQDICQANDIEEFGLDDEGVCALEFRDTLVINIALHANGEELLVYTPLGTVDEEDRDSILTDLLEANLFPQQPGSFCFALGDYDLVVLTASLPYIGLTAAAFQESLLPFLDLAQRWQLRLYNMTEPETEDAQESEPIADQPQEPAAHNDEYPPAEQATTLPPMPNHMAFMIKG